MPLPWKVAWVTGASSGIGGEIARQLAEQGVKVAATARHLPAIPAHPNISQFPADVTDEQALKLVVQDIEQRLGPIGLAIFSAGAYEPFRLETFSTQSFTHINSVNYLGTVHALGAVLPSMLQAKAGRIAIVASVAGYQGLPKASYYGPTKAALINLAETLWLELRGHGIGVSVVNPGFVATPMTKANDFPMPFLMTPERAAALTIKGLKAGRFEIAYPFPFVMILKALQKLPQGLKLRLIKRLTA
jgi:short-subunit dehydrogenase